MYRVTLLEKNYKFTSSTHLTLLVGTNILGSGPPSDPVTIPGLCSIAHMFIPLMFNILVCILQKEVINSWMYRSIWLQKPSLAYSFNQQKTVPSIVVLCMVSLGKTANHKTRVETQAILIVYSLDFLPVNSFNLKKSTVSLSLPAMEI